MSIEIASKEQLEQAAINYGLLPFFTNVIPGFSVQEMAAPGMLFSDTADGYGCWEWKGPVIREQTTAYGKFFRRKAGFVAMALLPDFLNYRRHAYPIEPGSREETILKIIRRHEGMTSTDLKRKLREVDPTANRRGSAEPALQRLQMGGWVVIADFEYKHTAQGQRYGWGIALYTTPEVWFEERFFIADCAPKESLARLTDALARRIPDVDRRKITKLLS